MREVRVGGAALEAIFLPEVGARLHRLRAFGHDLLRTPDDPAEHRRVPFFWGAYVMAPWCNRLATGPMTVGSAVVNLPANFPDGSAIHGQVSARPWTVDVDGVTCRCHGGADGWPWEYEVTLRAEAEGAALRIRLGLVNLAVEPMPAGLGFHPWWRRPVEVRFDARSVYASNLDAPRRPQPVGGAWDLSRPAEPAAGLDATWTDLATPLMELAWPELELAATLTLSSAATHVVVATPEEPRATAIEFQTHAPDGLARLLRGEPGGMRWLEPGDELSVELNLAVRRS